MSFPKLTTFIDNSPVHMSLLCLVCITPAHAGGPLVYDQPYDGISTGLPSQVYNDRPADSAYLFDDFTIPANQIWYLQDVLVRGQETGQPSYTTGSHYLITTAPAFGAPAYVIYSGGPADLEGNNLYVFPATGVLGPGTDWLSAWINRPTTGGQWLWNQTTPIRGSEAYIHNPGGGLGFGTSPIPVSSMPGSSGPRDLSFRLEYIVVTIPEPATVVCLGVGVLLVLVRRSR